MPRTHAEAEPVRAEVAADSALPALRDALKAITGELDHHVLLPTQHPQILVRKDGEQVDVRYEDRRWSFPRCDCVLLPMPNTTAELLASWIGRRLLDDLQRRTGVRPRRLQVEIDENHGQWAICELEGE